jgi:hypothetical protein
MIKKLKRKKSVSGMPYAPKWEQEEEEREEKRKRNYDIRRA